MPEGPAIANMFGGIAHRYDAANRVLSCGVDVLWRRRLVREVAAVPHAMTADLATGSGDVAFALAQGLPEARQILGLDFCEPMLAEARKKAQGFERRQAAAPRLEFQFGDCMQLPLPDAYLDVVTVAFGVRNFEDRQKGLAEMFRTLKPGGFAFVLEFSQPNQCFRPFYYAYLTGALPWVATVMTRSRSAYKYLGGSIRQFPGAPAFTQELEQVGFTSVKAMPMTCGVVALHRAQKPLESAFFN